MLIMTKIPHHGQLSCHQCVLFDWLMLGYHLGHHYIDLARLDNNHSVFGIHIVGIWCCRRPWLLILTKIPHHGQLSCHQCVLFDWLMLGYHLGHHYIDLVRLDNNHSVFGIHIVGIWCCRGPWLLILTKIPHHGQLSCHQCVLFDWLMLGYHLGHHYIDLARLDNNHSVSGIHIVGIWCDRGPWLLILTKIPHHGQLSCHQCVLFDWLMLGYHLGHHYIDLARLDNNHSVFGIHIVGIWCDRGPWLLILTKIPHHGQLSCHQCVLFDWLMLGYHLGHHYIDLARLGNNHSVSDIHIVGI